MKLSFSLIKILLLLITLACLSSLWFIDQKTFLAAPFSGNTLQATQIHRLIEDQAFPKKIIDATGREHILNKAPQRIVSTSLASDEILFKLAPMPSIASVTFLADQTSASLIAGKIPKHIPRNHADAEHILSLNPDLVIVASYTNANTISLLFASNIAVVRLNDVHSFDDIEHNVRLIAQAIGQEKKAQQWLDESRAQLDELYARQKLSAPPRILAYDLSGGSTGPGSLIDTLIRTSGGINALEETGIKGNTKISPELAASTNPDIIITGDWQLDGAQAVKNSLYRSKAWQNVDAIKNQQIIAMKPAWLTSATPFYIEGVEYLSNKMVSLQKNNIYD